MSVLTAVLAVLLLTAPVPTPAVGIGAGADASADGAASPTVDTPTPASGAALSLASLPPPTASKSASTPSIVAVYPNPLETDDAGEFVVLDVPRPTAVTLDDGETRVRKRLEAGRVALSADPTTTRALTSTRVVGVDGLSLANGGERLRLLVDERVVDVLVYTDAPAGERFEEREGRFAWTPLGYEPRPVVASGPAQATAFLLPDSPDVPLRLLRAADERILLAGYTFASERVTEALVSASQRGVRVRVLVDDAPVGGMSRRQARLLDRLAAAGVEVRVVGGEAARFSYHHAKYAVVDQAALVLTENWKPAGTGGHSSRGWGVRVDSPALAGQLATLFASDAAGRDSASWTRFRRGRQFEAVTAADGTFPTRHGPERLRVEGVRLLTAPGNAETAVVDELDAAEHRIDVLQPSVERRHAFTEALVRAARRGVRVRVLLSGAWYAREENEATVAWLNRRAERDDLPLEASVAPPSDRFEKVHAKGIVVDDTALVGSLNWNDHATSENREVVVALDGREAASYYRTAFDDDWRGERTRSPTLLVGLAFVGLVAVAALAWRRLRFEGPSR